MEGQLDFFLQRTHSLETTSLFDTLDPIPKIYEPKRGKIRKRLDQDFTEGPIRRIYNPIT